MSNIRLLSDTLASQVAAGEVVERPASVVKELLENSIDAGAENIEIRIRRGGISLIQVLDDGVGMDKTDALMSLERHATSKITTSDDLARIQTMGFRGEALPSIASVARFRLTTREKNALAGTEILVEGGKLKEVKEAGEAPGTHIEVRSLFYNLPARRKFLRTENTEFSHIEHQVRVHAIAHPGIRFHLVHNDRTIFHLPRTETLFERIRGLIGTDLAKRLVAIREQTRNGIRLSGYIGEPGLGRSNRSLQLVFLNKRPIEGAVLQYGLREGYHTALMKGQHPLTFLFLDMDPAQFDVNVHPAKREVRFRDGNTLRHTLVDVIAESLEASVHAVGTPRPDRLTSSTSESTSDPAPAQPLPSTVANRAPTIQGDLLPPAEQHRLRNDWMVEPSPALPSPPSQAGVRPETSKGEEAPEVAVSKRVDVPSAGDFKILGVLGKLYVLMENDGGLVLMDQHAAHERVLFEQMRRRMEQEGVPTQQLLVPITLQVSPREFDLISRHLPSLQKLGIGAESFGANTFKIDCLPTFVDERDSNRFVNDVLEELQKEHQGMSSMRLGEDMVATTVCRHAVKANDMLHMEELRQLLADLLACDLPFCCPHGRPTLVQISYRELERKFGRIQS